MESVFLQSLLRKLTNLSSGNKMVFLPGLSPGRHIDFTQLGFIENNTAFAQLEQAVAGRPVNVCRVVDPRIKDVNKLSLALRRLKQTADRIFEESGSRDLHLAWIFAQGKFSNGQPVRCPLLLIPVELVQEDNVWKIIPSAHSGKSFNKSFLYAFSRHQGTPLAEDLLEEDFDDFPDDSISFRNKLYQIIESSNLELNFNRDNFSDQLLKFLSIHSADLDKQYSDGSIKLYPEAVLGIFPQADSFLEPDYHELMKNPSFQQIEGFFESIMPALDQAGLNSGARTVPEAKMMNVFPVDPWQEHAMKEVKRGNSLVVVGPPGTGKSQLISSLVVDAIANNRTVLVVSQKRAALDVVWSRMREVGMERFCALVHDFRNDRNKIYEDISNQLERLDEYRRQNVGLDAIRLDRMFLTTSNRIDQIVEELEAFRTALVDHSVCGVSIKELYLEADRRISHISLKRDLNLLHFDCCDDFIRRVTALADHNRVLKTNGDFWIHRKSFAGFTFSEFTEIKNSLIGFHPFLEELNHKFNSADSKRPDYAQWAIFMNQLTELKVISSVNTPELYPFISRAFERATEDPSELWLTNVQRLVADCFKGVGVEATISTTQLGIFQLALQSARRASSNLISWFFWKVFSKNKMLIYRAMQQNHLEGRAGFKILEQRLDNRLNLEHQLSKLSEREWTLSLPKIYTYENFQSWFEQSILALKVRRAILETRSLVNYLQPNAFEYDRFTQVLKSLVDCTEKFADQFKVWTNYFLPGQLDVLGDNPLIPVQEIEYLDKNFDRLCAADRLVGSFQSWELEIVNRVYEAWPDEYGRQLALNLKNSIQLSWIDFLEERNPQLRMVSSGVIEQLELELKQLLNTKFELSRDIALLRVRERICDELVFNRLNNLVTYRDLKHQVSKKRKVWPIRKLIQEYHEEVFKLMPCWLASPESVSAIFPMVRYFDLVIFDEASQCFTEKGIPAMARGKQVVIAGDPMQLKPSDLYQVRWDDLDDAAELEMDSLLDFATSRLKIVHLQAHYRSRSPELIYFSNQYFYKGKLKTLPDRNLINSKQSAFEYENVNGIWEDQCNTQEAIRVSQRIFELTKIYPGKSLGVITFNFFQQQLILDMVSDLFQVNNTIIPENLMIKNIENVQGDERDIILFSTGYAPDAKGKFSLQFGSLNQLGGEHRLNVAITRAREKIIVITSLDPGSLDTGELKNRGPALFKAWLEFVRDRAELKPLNQQQSGLSHSPSWYLRKKIISNNSLVSVLKEEPFAFCDLVTVGRDGYERVFLTDDENYLESLTPKFHHALLGQVLENQNWSWKMCFSRNYWLDRDKFLEDLKIDRGGFD